MSRAPALRARRARSSSSSRRSSRARLRGELLESRSLLAADITFAANVLTINVTGAGETVNLDVVGTDLNITSNVGTTADAAAQALGFGASTGGGGANTGSIAAGNDVRRIDIFGAAGVQTINFNGGTFTATTVAGTVENVNFQTAPSTFRKISASAANADLTVTAGVTLTQTAAASISTINGGTITLINAAADGNVAVNALIDSSSGGGNIQIIADNMAVGSTLKAGAGIVTLQPFDAARNIDVGTDGVAGKLCLTDAELDRVTASVLRVGVQAGSVGISVTATIDQFGSLYGSLSLLGNGTITDTAAGSLAIFNLRVSSASGVTLDSAANNAVHLAGSVTGAGNDFLFVNLSGFIIDTIDGVAGINISPAIGSIITLTAGAPVIQTAGSDVSGNALQLNGAGRYTLTNPDNAVTALGANLTAAGTGTLTYVNNGLLQIGSFSAPFGITTNNSNVTISTVDGELLVLNSDGDATPDIDLGSGVLSLTAGSGGGDRLLEVEADAHIIATGGVTLVGENIDIQATVNAGANAANVRPFQAGTLINLGGADGASTLGLSDAEIDRITAGILRVGAADSGNIFVSAAITPAGASVLSLQTAGGITQAAGATITTGDLAIRAGNTVTLNADNDVLVTSLAAVVTNSGESFNFTDVNSITIGSVDGVNGISTNDGDVNVRAKNGGVITLNSVSAAVFASVDVPKTVPPLGSGGTGTADDIALSDVIVAGLGGLILDVNVTIDNLLHTFDGDLEITLISPTGTRITLANRRGGSSSNFLNTVFDDGAATSISAGASPFTGSFLPEEPLAGLNVQVPNGTWTLEINDRAAGDVGTLNAWSISFVTTFAGGAISTTGGNITLTADDMAIDGFANAGGGAVTLQPETNPRPIDLGTNAAGSLGLTDAELDFVSATMLRIGRTDNTGDISLTAPITLDKFQLPALSLRTGGAILDGTASDQTDLTVESLGLRAASGIGNGDDLDVNVSGLAASNSTSGAINITSANFNGSGVSIGGVDGITQTQNQAPGAPLTIIGQGGVFVFDSIRASGNLTLIAPPSPGPGDFVQTAPNGETIESTAGDVILQAGDAVVINGMVTVNAFTSILATGGFGELDGGGGVDDLGTTNAPVIIFSGGPGSDYFLMIPFGGSPLITILGQGGNDTFDITPKPTIAFAIDGGAPVFPTFPGDVLNVDLSSAINPVFTPGGVGAGTFTFDNFQPVTFASIEFVSGDDYGDAPDTYGTLFASGGARHHLSSNLYLGSFVDFDLDGQPTANASGDDTDADGDDEDGVTLPATFIAGLQATITVNVTGTGFLDAWIDFNVNGMFDPGEQIATSLPVVNGNNVLQFFVPTAGTVDGASFARFRLSSTGALGPTGPAVDGEVEDYPVDLTVVPPGSAGVFPDPNNPGQFILIASGGNGNDTILIDPVYAFNYRVMINGKTKLVVPNDSFQSMAVFGLDGKDTIIINPGLAKPALIEGGAGNDKIFGGIGSDTIFGGPGNDTIYGRAGNDLIFGEEGNDTIYGQDGKDTIDGGANNDQLFGDGGDDLLRGGDGNDTLTGGNGNDILLGGLGNDKLLGGAGRDLLIGGNHKDSLLGDKGDDILIAGTTVHDNDDIALTAILAEWSSNLSYATRVAGLQGGGGFNLAAGVDVFNDGFANSLKGQGDKDYFLFAVGQDSTDKASGELFN